MGLVLALAVSAAGGAAGAALAFDAKPIPAISESFGEPIITRTAPSRARARLSAAKGAREAG